jgi:hypothetical protein
VTGGYQVNLDVVNWLVKVSFRDDEENWFAMEMRLEDFPGEFRKIVAASLKAIGLAETFIKMREDGATVEEMDREMRLIAMDGGV